MCKASRQYSFSSNKEKTRPQLQFINKIIALSAIENTCVISRKKSAALKSRPSTDRDNAYMAVFTLSSGKLR